MQGRGNNLAEIDICLQDIGNRITELRKRLGWTQEELAEKADLTPQFVSYAESGKRAMRPENLLKLSKALNVSADYLLTGEIIDKDLLILSDKIKQLSPSQIRIIENIVTNAMIYSTKKEVAYAMWTTSNFYLYAGQP